METANLDIDKIVRYWRATAADDLIAVQHLFEAGDYTHALFFGHLYLEKMLKAQIVRYRRQHAPYSHNLRLLAEQGGLKLTSEQEAFLIRMTQYHIRTRYPDMAQEFKKECTREFCEAQLEKVREFGTWIEQMMTS